MNNYNLQSTKFRNKYRVESARLKHYDYSSNGEYFITICTKNREYFFGEIINGVMKLSEIGKIAQQFWQEIETLHNFIELDEWIIMPNHIHGIIFIKNIPHRDTPMQCRDTPVACLYKYKHGNDNEQQRKFGQLQRYSVSSIINHYKGFLKRWADKNNYRYFYWQKNYYEHIIRSEGELNRIREYIFYNPLNWEQDRNNLRK